MASVEVARHREPADAVRPAEAHEIDSMMRHLFGQHRADGVEAEAPAAVQPARPRRDFDTACELLERASQAFDLLMGRCQTLEAELEGADARARAQGIEQAETLDRWQRLAVGLKSQLADAERAAAAAKTRCDAAEAHAAQAEAKIAALERASAQAAGHAALAESLSTKLHDKVVSAFGIGSRAHPVLEAVATQTLP